MTLKGLLSLYAVVAGLFFLGLVVGPAFWIVLYGATPDPQATVLLRLVGALFGGLAVMAWVGRSAEPSRSRDAMVLGLIVLNGLAALASVWGALSGVYNQFAWGPVVTFTLCAVGFLPGGARQHVARHHEMTSDSTRGRFNRRYRALLLGGFLIGCLGPPAEAAEDALGVIDQAFFVPLGGLDQWISIRGDDRRNPVLLVVHGGPGEAQWPLAAHYRSWEKSFIVVQWDQRGAGHTYGRYGAKTPDMMLDRISRDGVELADYLCRTLSKKKIIVLGHSWGSIIAVSMVQRQPELFAAYVGTGMVGSWKGAIKVKYDLVLARLRADGDAASVKQLEASGPPDPNDASKVFAFNDRVYPLWAPSDAAWIKSLRADVPRLKAAYPKDFKDFEEGFRFSVDKAVPDQRATDLVATASRIETAFFVIQGRDDVITPTKDAVDYFNRVAAPYKKLVLIPNAGHFAFMTEPTPFLDALVRTVRPVAVERGAISR